MKYIFVSESNNKYYFEILSDNVVIDSITIYSPNYDTAISRLENYIQSQEYTNDK